MLSFGHRADPGDVLRRRRGRDEVGAADPGIDHYFHGARAADDAGHPAVRAEPARLVGHGYLTRCEPSGGRP
jgi:hypothetical protein